MDERSELDMRASGGELFDLDDVDQIDFPLNILTAQIEKIGRIIDAARARQSARVNDWRVDHPDGLIDDSDELVAKAQAIYRFRRKRDLEFDNGMFADPRWDILLDLFIAGKQKRQISVSSACIASSVPSTTALRHLDALVQRGLVERVSSKVDLRRHWVDLTDDSRAKMEKLVRSFTMPGVSKGIGS